MVATAAAVSVWLFFRIDYNFGLFLSYRFSNFNPSEKYNYTLTHSHTHTNNNWACAYDRRLMPSVAISLSQKQSSTSSPEYNRQNILLDLSIKYKTNLIPTGSECPVLAHTLGQIGFACTIVSTRSVKSSSRCVWYVLGTVSTSQKTCILNYAWFVVVRVRPIPMEVHDVGMLELSEAFKHLPNLVFLGLVVFALRELHLVPHHLHALFSVHGQVRAVDSGNISLLHLQENKTKSTR
ncbi:hypothetical protein AGLY_003597, partial [Aphis glycines]